MAKVDLYKEEWYPCIEWDIASTIDQKDADIYSVIIREVPDDLLKEYDETKEKLFSIFDKLTAIMEAKE